MSKPSKKGVVDKQMEANVVQFCGVTGAGTREAGKYLTKYKRLDVSIDAYFNNPGEFPPSASKPGAPQPSTSKLNALFDSYKEPDEEEIGITGTIKFCEDLNVNPEDVVLLAIAYDLKSPKVGEWNRAGWVEGWKANGCDTIGAMSGKIDTFRSKLGSDAAYFQKVYNATFDFAKEESAQRSIAIETAISFWGLLLPHGLQNGALSHLISDDDDEEMSSEEETGFSEEHVEWWFEFLRERAGKGVSKDTWVMFLDFVRTIDSKFLTYDMEGSWPSTIDDFVDWAKERLAKA